MSESVKAKLLKALIESGGKHMSGALLARELSISRNAIWKAAESLRREGYSISAATKKGYRLDNSSGSLSEAGITGYIKTTGVFTVETRKSVTSTNTILREMAAKGAREGYVLAAEEQTAGRGRQGREFYSPPGCGAYFSALLRPRLKAGDASLVTSAAAVAAARAIEEITGVSVGIKWVNDLYYKDKKVCGILTEANFDMESGLADSIVIGIGINITRPKNGFGAALDDVAISLTEETEGKENTQCRIIAATLDNFWKYYKNLQLREFLREYRQRSTVLGREIYILSGKEKKIASAISIDDECRLVARYENGEIVTLNSGEVRVRSSQ
ncbi:MAG: biotin--[acetyl-CoA-carboxylase] ligase [Oscillospiraceae bacterium]|nr:biotin--[acetyl-CoA-carboxylase] ligase [Oscillospiraceae bacterium]